MESLKTTFRARRFFPVLFVACAASLWALPAAAEPSEAQRLFDEARALAEAGRWSEACPRLAESLSLEPNMTTQFRLADCYERTGKIASAWSNYVGAARAAAAAGEAGKERFANERAGKLEPRVDKLLIITPEMPALSVERNGRPVPRESWNAPMPVDPGEHTVHAWAPGKESFDIVVKLKGLGETRRVEVPMLGPGIPLRIGEQRKATIVEAPPAAPMVVGDVAPPRPAREGRESSWRAIGWALGGAGLAGVLVGGGLFLGQVSQSPPCSGSTCVPAMSTLTAGALAVVLGAIVLVSTDP